MKKTFTVLMLLYGSNCISQEKSSYTIYFPLKDTTITKDKKEDRFYQFKIAIDKFPKEKNLKLTLEVDESRSTLPGSDYTLDFKEIYLTAQTEVTKTIAFYLKIKKDTVSDRSRKLYLKLVVIDTTGKVDKDNSSENNLLTITINGINDLNFSYLAYIGTNFDLVDGIKAKNLFFATNIFLPHITSTKGVGFYLSLYGNRTLSTIDSTGSARITSGIANVIDSTSSNYYWDQAKMVRSRVSDNLGAYCSPLINMGRISRKSNNIQLYFSPSMEFVWRRTMLSIDFSERVRTDTAAGSSNLPSFTENKYTTNINEYNFNVGFLGFFICHESPKISMRLHCSVGYSGIYRTLRQASPIDNSNVPYGNTSDIFFCGRVWITESISGLTLQAEVTNNLINYRPYFGVTISKAIDFKHLGNIFQPIASRN